VRSGDTLWDIARRYGVTVPELTAANNLSSRAPLRMGMKLTIPVTGSGTATVAAQTPSTTYKVRSDTLSRC
jgi:membrane-bound lytic murein transglycosylase D